jgi:exonuclease SbcC
MNHNPNPADQHDMPPERMQALDQAQQLHDETQAADFLLQCSWPDARLKAADWIHSRPLLEHVLAAVRNSDRRVEKLLQQRLDVLAEREAATARGQRAVEHAQSLVAATPLLVNQVADLDREWSLVGDAPEAVRAEFDALREQLRQRLDAQAQLQHAVLDVGSRLQRLIADAEPSGGQLLAPAQVAATLDQLEEEMAGLWSSTEAPSLPKRVLTEFRHKHEALRAALGTLQERYAAVMACQDLLLEWEESDPGALDEAVVRQQWQALAPLHPLDDAALQERFRGLLAKLAGRRQSDADGETERRRQARDLFSQSMLGMEEALRNGALLDAAAHEHKLRDMDLSLAHLRGEQKMRLQTARAELARLQGWAKWGGKISREELLKTAQDLPSRKLSVTDLAREVPGLRERWKALDATAGPANKDAWQRFDAACTAAYAPAAEHFKKLAKERQDNLERARALLAEVRVQAEQLEQAGKGDAAAESGDTNESVVVAARADVPQPDWKAIAGFCDRMQQLWRRLGPIDRKPKKTLDTEFATAMVRLTRPLSVLQSEEKNERERLIDAAQAIDPAQRRAAEELQALQQRWQQRARNLPLDRHDEHALWQRFRAACDQLFAKRKQHVKSADAERSTHLREREALCARLEAALQEKPDAIRPLVREARAAWTKFGAVPRAAERQIETRFQRALAGLQKRLDDGERGARQMRGDVLAQRFGLCLELERSLMAGEPAATGQQARIRWEGLPTVSTEAERALSRRFEQGMQALESRDAAYPVQLQKNLPLLTHELLRAEIQLGIDSPPAFARERLKVQVEVLQSSLKSGEKSPSPHSLLLQLCSLPAPIDAQGEQRLRAVANRLA